MKIIAEKARIDDIADAVRRKLNVETQYKLSEIPPAINSIYVGGELVPLSVTANGDYTPPSGVDGFSEAHVAVPSYPEPTGTIQITQNGTVNVKDYASAEVNVSGGGGAVVQPLSVTQNGIYNPPSGLDGYAPVTVDVREDDPFALTNYIESSGTQYIDTGYISNDSTKLELVANINSNNAAYATPFGAGDSGGTVLARKEILIYAKTNGNNFPTYNWGLSDGQELASVSMGKYYNYKSIYILSKNSIVFRNQDGVRIDGDTFTGGTVTSQNSIYLFTFNTNGSDFGAITHCTMKLYRFRVYEGDTLAHEFIPWQENGVACLKDTMTGDIKYNAGTGDFVYGTDA